MTPSIPTLPAYRTADGTITAWCNHCRRWHQHGGCRGDCTPERRRGRFIRGSACNCPPGTGTGHRLAHCHCRCSPYRDTGYYLQETGELFTPAIAQMHRCR